MKKTKIIATIGPSSMSYATMKKMVQAGMNIVRINFSHATSEDMDNILSIVKKIRKDLNIPLPIMIDTRGPELRVKTFKNGKAIIKKGKEFIFSARNFVGDENSVSINLPSIVKSIKVGDKILACDGLITFKVIDVQGKDVVTKALNGGVISDRKSLFIPGIKFNTPYLNDADKQGILWGIKNDVDFVAASFVNSKKDVLTLKRLIESNSGNMKIIAKIESKLGVENLDEIIDVADGIMVARGDLGVELAMEKLPAIQKMIIKKCNKIGKPVITATEMLESMIHSNRPTRAEVSDVANAVYDGTGCVMLSGETTVGDFPVEAVDIMAKVCKETERNIKFSSNIGDELDNIVLESAKMNVKSNIKAIVSFAKSGIVTGKIARLHPQINVIGICKSQKTFREFEINWGVMPKVLKKVHTQDEMLEASSVIVKDDKICNIGDTIVVTLDAKAQNDKSGFISIVKVK